MGRYVFKLPDIGEGIVAAELIEWHVKPGDEVAQDDLIVEVMTDKATVEITAPVSGKVVTLAGDAGDQVAVGSALITFEVEGEGNAGADDEAAESSASEPAGAAASPSPAASAGSASGTAEKSAVPAENISAPQRIPGREAAPAAPGGDIPAGAATAGPGFATRGPGQRPTAAPAVRRRARELGIDLAFVPGSGPAGRITHKDLDAYVAAGGKMPATGFVSAGTVRREGAEQIRVIGLRRAIAEKMQASKRHIPHFTYVEEVDVTALESLRADLNRRYGGERGKLTPLPFIIRAITLALLHWPQCNATYDDEANVVTRHGAVHMGIATQTDGGLMVPVLRHAEAMDLWEMAAGIRRLAEGARAGKLPVDELTGSTITITSLGPLAGIVTTPVINRPEVGIIGPNKIVPRPVIVDGRIETRMMMNLSSSFDHRVVDGYDAAEMIQYIKGLLEQPAILFME